MKVLLDWIPFIQPYPDWVKLLVVLYALGGVAIVGVMIFFYPSEMKDTATEFTVDEIRVSLSSDKSELILDIMFRNPMDEPVNLASLLLSFYEDEKPTGGLQGRQSVSATYTVAQSNDSEALDVNVSDSIDTESLLQISIEYPFMGQSFAQLQIPLVQSMDGRSTDRIKVRLEAETLNLKRNNRVEAFVRYNGQDLTVPYVALIEDV